MRTVQRSALCRSRRELFDAYFLAKFGFDTAESTAAAAAAEKEPSKSLPDRAVQPAKLRLVEGLVEAGRLRGGVPVPERAAPSTTPAAGSSS